MLVFGSTISEMVGCLEGGCINENDNGSKSIPKVTVNKTE